MIVYFYVIYFDDKSDTGYRWTNEIKTIDITEMPDMRKALVEANGKILQYHSPGDKTGFPAVSFIHQDEQKLKNFFYGLEAMWKLCYDPKTRPKFKDDVDLPENTFYYDFIKGLNNG